MRVKTEEDPLDPEEGTAMHAGAMVIRHVEDVVVKAGGAALRYGPGATDDQVELVRKRQFPLVGGGRRRRAKARRELGWELRCPSWRQGFREDLA